MHFTLYADGGARGNPGPAGSGAVAFDTAGKRVLEVSDYVGETTNNVAEYEAVLRGLSRLGEMYPKGYFSQMPVVVRLDSELIVKQMNGIYKVKHPNLVPRHLELKNIISRSFPQITFEHVRRELNKDADALANAAMDRES